jgi:hypothetical protein
MKAETIKELLDKRPFKPLRIHMSDKSRFDIKPPEFIIVLRDRLVIGVPENRGTGIMDHLEHCSLLHVTRVEEIEKKNA